MSWLKKILTKLGGTTENLPTELAEEEFLAPADLENWFEHKIDSKFEHLKNEIADGFSKIGDQIELLQDNLDVLREKELQNPNIPERAVQIMDGNRDGFISQHNIFMENINIPDNPTFKSTLIFCERYSLLLERLIKSTGKSTAILNEFFSNQVAEINKSIKGANNSVNEMKQKLLTEEKGVEFVEEIKKDIEEFNIKLKREQELNEEITYTKKKLDSSLGMKQKLETDIEKLKTREDYGTYNTLESEKEKFKKEKKQIENELFHLFFQLEKIFRKYSRISITHDKLITKYLENCTEAAINDESNQIVDALEKMQTAIETGNLEIKDSNKTIDKIKKINSDFLDDFRFKYKDLRTSIKRIDLQMKSNRAIQEIADLKYKIDHTDEQIKLLNDKISRFNKSLEKLELDEAKRNLQIKIKKAIHIKVTIQKNTETISEEKKEELNN
ncbi:hypothetical protein HN587_02340 [Candidatus Woesearchaeota archaeon]|jgi:hypothetical protein|nr:hypothetical protein [Candidatus Woesearchaeota archaeon]